MNKLTLAIDFNNMVFASYYSTHLINSKGQDVNAVKGFFQKMKNLKETFDPDYIVLASDISRQKTFRRKLYPLYKAQRKPHDQQIIEQMKIISQMVALLGFQTVNDEIYEADDCLGMIAKYDEEHDIDTVIISSDHDLWQLITDHTFIMSPRASELVDKEYLYATMGLTPDQIIELKILAGDNSDNYKGIPGIGNKTALELLHDYGTVDNIYNHLSELKPNIQKHMMAGKGDLEMLRKLVTIVRDYNLIGFTEDRLHRLEPYPDEILNILEEWEVDLYNVMNYTLFPQRNDKIQVYPQEVIADDGSKDNPVQCIEA